MEGVRNGNESPRHNFSRTMVQHVFEPRAILSSLPPSHHPRSASAISESNPHLDCRGWSDWRDRHSGCGWTGWRIGVLVAQAEGGEESYGGPGEYVASD